MVIYLRIPVKGGPNMSTEVRRHWSYAYDDATTVSPQNIGFNQLKRLNKSYDKRKQCFGLTENKTTWES
jgi:hypothetical protein